MPGLFGVALSASQHRISIDSTKRKLAEVHKRLKQAQADVDSPNKRKPYDLLESLLKQLDSRIAELEDSINSRRIPPETFAFDEYIFGDPRTGEWHLGDSEDKQMWDHGLRLKKRLAGFMAQRGPLVEEIQKTKGEMESLKSRIQKTTQRLKGLSRVRRLSRGSLLLLLLGLGGLIGGGVLVALGTTLPGAAVAGVGLLFMLLIPMNRARRRRRIERLKRDITQWRAELDKKALHMKQLKAEYMPLSHKLTELKEEYASIRKMFG